MVARRSEGTADNDPTVAADADLDMAAKSAVGFVGGVAMSRDRLDYLADMILELQQMATDFGHDRLARQLALAYAEAALTRRKLQPAG